MGGLRGGGFGNENLTLYSFGLSISSWDSSSSLSSTLCAKDAVNSDICTYIVSKVILDITMINLLSNVMLDNDINLIRHEER